MCVTFNIKSSRSNPLFFSALLVPLGGTLFEGYVKVFCTEDCVRKLRRVHEQGDDGPDRVMTTEEFYNAFEPTTRSFYGFLLTSCARLNQRCRRQLYWHTANAVFHGLSRSGVKVQASLGLMMKLSSFDDMRKQHISKVGETIRYVLLVHK